MLTKPGIRRFVILPLLINFILFSLIIGLGLSYFGDLVDSILISLPTWLHWLEWLIWPLVFVTILVIGFFCSLQLANLVAAPFNGLLSEAVNNQLNLNETGETSDWTAVFEEIIPAIKNEFHKLGYFCIRAIPLLILFIIPGVNIIASVLWLLFCIWMMALEFIDYPMSNAGVYFKELRNRLTEKRLVAVGFGSAALVLTLIPVINFIAMPAAVAGATIFYHEEYKNR